MELTKELILNRKNTYHGIYHDVGTILDNFTTETLFKFVKDNLNMNVCLRAYLENQIIDWCKNI